MAFSFKNAQGNADDIDIDVQNSAGHEREEKVLDAIKGALQKIVDAVGGHLVVSATGHVNEEEGNPGDSLNVQVNSILKPSGPTPDAGAEAVLGSPANYPPEASTAAPQTADGSPAASQEAIPQPADPAVTGNPSEDILSGAAEAPSQTAAEQLQAEPIAQPEQTEAFSQQDEEDQSSE